MRIFVINLDQDVDKLRKVSLALTSVNVPFERFPAVYGHDMTQQEKRIATNIFRVWCAIGRPLTDGELGCTLSHLNLYRKMKDENIPSAIALEDDVIFTPDFQKQIDRVESFVNVADPRVVLLSDRCHSKIADWTIVPSQHDFGTFAYAINLSAAKAILMSNYPVQRPCDHWRKWVSTGAITLFHAYPTVCDYDHSVNSCTAEVSLVKNYSPLRFLLHKSLRVIGKSLDRMLP